MQLFKRLAAWFAVALTMIVVLFGSPEALELNATPLQSLFMIKQLVPQATSVGLLWKQSDYANTDLLTQIKRASMSTGDKVVVGDVESLPQVASQFRNLVDNYHVQVLWVIRNDDIMNSSIAQSYLIKNAAISGVPLFAPSSNWVSAGACAAVVTEGQSTKLVVNQKTLNALGLKVPQKFASVTQVLASK